MHVARRLTRRRVRRRVLGHPGRRQRDVGAPASGVVSIRAHANYRPDYSTLASAQVVAARQKLGLTHAEFADHLSDALGWPVYESAVKRWETRKAPPGDALLACAATLQGVPSPAVPPAPVVISLR